jgi:hypothetical protein
MSSHDTHVGNSQPIGHISAGVKTAVVLGVMLAILQGLFVGLSSGYGRVWPASDSAKIQLPPANLNG